MIIDETNQQLIMINNGEQTRIKIYDSPSQLPKSFDTLVSEEPMIEMAFYTNGSETVAVKTGCTVHELKILPEYFNAVNEGIKTFEVGKNDRDFKIGDLLLLREFENEKYTGRSLKAEITYILANDYCKKGYCIMSVHVQGTSNIQGTPIMYLACSDAEEHMDMQEAKIEELKALFCQYCNNDMQIGIDEALNCVRHWIGII